MIETADGLANVDEIAATPGLDGLYIGPSDLTLALGGQTSDRPGCGGGVRRRPGTDPAGVRRQRHRPPASTPPSGAVAAQRLAAGFRFVSIASDLTHLEAVAQAHLAAAKEAG